MAPESVVSGLFVLPLHLQAHTQNERKQAPWRPSNWYFWFYHAAFAGTFGERWYFASSQERNKRFIRFVYVLMGLVKVV